jgi:hypothetical protein
VCFSVKTDGAWVDNAVAGGDAAGAPHVGLLHGNEVYFPLDKYRAQRVQPLCSRLLKQGSVAVRHSSAVWIEELKRNTKAGQSQ